jgi:hypothetical protein
MFPFLEMPGKKKEKFIQEQLQIEEYPIEYLKKEEKKEKDSKRGVEIIELF